MYKVLATALLATLLVGCSSEHTSQGTSTSSTAEKNMAPAPAARENKESAVPVSTRPLSAPKGGRLVELKKPLIQYETSKPDFHSKPITLEDGSKVLELHAKRVLPRVWGANLALNVKPEGIKKGDSLLIKFTARTIASEYADGSKGQLDLLFKLSKKVPKPSVQKRLVIPYEWKTFYIAFSANADAIGKDIRLSILLGGLPKQTIQIKELTITDYDHQYSPAELPLTSINYVGQAGDAPWRKEAAENIEQLRKAGFTLNVVDAAGQPVAAEISAELSRHAYDFGCGLPALKLFKQRGITKAEREAELAKIAEMCNKVTINNALKWRYQKPELLDPAMEWAKAHDIPVRGHAMVWGRFKSASKEVEKQEKHYRANPEEFRTLVRQRVADAGAMYTDQITDWDVINEPSPEKDFVDILGKPEAIEWLKLAKLANPKATRCANDYGIISRYDAWHQDAYYEWLKYYTKHNAIDKVCVQGHYKGPIPMSDIKARLDRLAEFGLPIVMTEHDYFEIDPQLKADFTRDLMTLFFSHHATDGIIFWNLNDYYDADWNPTPAGAEVKRLLQQEWHTAAKLISNTEGQAQFRGFKGRYSMTVTAGGQSKQFAIDLSKSTQATISL